MSAFTLGLGSFALVPYIETAKAYFYQDLLHDGMRLDEEIVNSNPQYYYE